MNQALYSAFAALNSVRQAHDAQLDSERYYNNQNNLALQEQIKTLQRRNETLEKEVKSLEEKIKELRTGWATNI